VPVGDGRQPADVGHRHERVGDGLDEQEARLGLERGIQHQLVVGSVHVGDRDAAADQLRPEELERAAVHGQVHDHVVAGRDVGEHRQGDGGHARGINPGARGAVDAGGQRRHGVVVGLPVPGVDVPGRRPGVDRFQLVQVVERVHGARHDGQALGRSGRLGQPVAEAHQAGGEVVAHGFASRKCGHSNLNRWA